MMGALGVSSEQTSGIITQDGITYVPETGRPLQTQGISPPTADNKATAFVSTIETGIDASAAAASTQQVGNAEQAKKTLEIAGLGWDEELEGCGPDPEHGANPWGCKVWVSWGRGVHLNEYLAVHGHWSCEVAPADIEVEILCWK
jgi:hypothetical protein